MTPYLMTLCHRRLKAMERLEIEAWKHQLDLQQIQMLALALTIHHQRCKHSRAPARGQMVSSLTLGNSPRRLAGHFVALRCNHDIRQWKQLAYIATCNLPPTSRSQLGLGILDDNVSSPGVFPRRHVLIERRNVTCQENTIRLFAHSSHFSYHTVLRERELDKIKATKIFHSMHDE